MSMNTPPQAPRAPQGSQAKSRMVAAILTFFLGRIGVGDFYLLTRKGRYATDAQGVRLV